jgi:hypothetical protein
MKYEITVKKKVLKNIPKLPTVIQEKFFALLARLEELGPVRPELPNYSKLGKDEHHCHLGYSWAACWINKKGKLQIEVYYVGSRENAPY